MSTLLISLTKTGLAECWCYYSHYTCYCCCCTSCSYCWFSSSANKNTVACGFRNSRWRSFSCINSQVQSYLLVRVIKCTATHARDIDIWKLGHVSKYSSFQSYRHLQRTKTDLLTSQNSIICHLSAKQLQSSFHSCPLPLNFFQCSYFFM